MTLIIGSEGSMGKRYQAILKHLDAGFECLDMDNLEEGPTLLAKAKRIIIATPTNTHLNIISMLAPYHVPVLCEKPLTKSRDELRHIEQIHKNHNLDLTMMMQYSEYELEKKEEVYSGYNYFRHGNDGLIWDCFQILALHEGDLSKVKLEEESPIWMCILNGNYLDLSRMDYAYVNFVREWVAGNKSQSMDYLVSIHEKVRTYEEKYAI